VSAYKVKLKAVTGTLSGEYKPCRLMMLSFPLVAMVVAQPSHFIVLD
jgi:hypothetical protein